MSFHDDLDALVKRYPHSEIVVKLYNHQGQTTRMDHIAESKTKVDDNAAAIGEIVKTLRALQPHHRGTLTFSFDIEGGKVRIVEQQFSDKKTYKPKRGKNE